MQKITVASVNKKEGTNDRGPWTLVIIKDDTGSEFTSFDKKLLDLTIGAVIELEAVIKNGKVNIKEWKLLSEGSAQVSPSGNGGSQMSKEDWDKKDRITRLSIEAQKKADLIVQLRIAGVIKDEHPLFQQALEWLGGGVQEPTKAKPGSSEAATENTPIKNVGDLLTRCAKINVTKAHLLELHGLSDIAEIKDLDMAWAKAQADAQFNQM